MPSNITVTIENFAQSHFIDGFAKRYKERWNITWDAIEASLKRIDTLLLTSKATVICESGDIAIIKMEFRVDRSTESAKTSGNRVIVAWHTDTQKIAVLLLYNKTDISAHNETTAWKRLIRENYPEYVDVIKKL